MSEILSWQLHPQLGLGKLTLNARRNDIRAVVDDVAKSVTRGFGAFIVEVDAFYENAVQVHYDGGETAEFIEIGRPQSVLIVDQDVIGISRGALQTLCQKQGWHLQQSDADCDRPLVFDAGVSFYFEKNVVESVAVFRRGYFDHLRQTLANWKS